MIFKYDELNEVSLIEGAIYKGGNSNNPMRDDPLAKLFKLNGFKRSLGNQGGFRKATKEIDGKICNGKFAFVVIVDSGKQPEWQNSYDNQKRIFTYYGDNRKPNNYILNTKNKGNEFLLHVFKKAYGTMESRIGIPPIFIFQSTGDGCDKKFIGLAVPGVKGKPFQEVLKVKRFNKEGEGEFENYCAQFTILPLKNEKISREWLQFLKQNPSPICEYTPQVWSDFVTQGHNIVADDNVLEITYNDGIYATEKERSVKVRIVQGKFREGVIKRDLDCQLCHINIHELLIASHIKPWAKCVPREQIDLNNGTLFCVTHDSLFDKGYISFSDDGKILISHLISQEMYEKLQININIKINLNKQQKEYMKFHRENIYKR